MTDINREDGRCPDIEQLRAEREVLRKTVNEQAVAIATVIAEHELQAVQHVAVYDRLRLRIDELEAECERLRADVVQVNDLVVVKMSEIERLRAVLRYISELDDDGEAPGLARRALEPKP